MRLLRTLGALAVGCSLVGTALAQQTPFTTKAFIDVPSSHPSFKAIEFLRENNIVRGYQDGSFKPGNRINRAEFVRLVVNPFFLNTLDTDHCISLNIDKSATTVYFKDVSRDSWFAPQVCAAFKAGVIDGYDDNTFRGGKYITFVESAKIISNIFVGNVVNDTDPKDWYKPYVKWLADAHAIPMTITSLEQLITRDEMAEMAYRLHTKNTSLKSRTYAELVK